MDIYAKKILSFLQKNPSLDLESADIAFHLKMDEQFVQNYMSSLLRQGIVINRRNEYGRIYWYSHNKNTEEADIPLMEPAFIPVDSGSEHIVKEKRNDDLDQLLGIEEKRLPVLKILFSVALIAAFIALAYLGFDSLDRRIIDVSKSIDAIQMVTVKKSDLNRLEAESSFLIKNIESQIAGLTLAVDSLKTFLAKEQQKKINDMKIKKTVKKRKK